MKKLIFIPLLIFSVLCNAQFTKGGGTFLKTTNSFMSAAATPFDGGMINNGDFANADHWGVDAVWSIGSGVATYADGQYGAVYQTAADMVTAIETNHSYTLEFDLVAAGNAVIEIANSAGAVTYHAITTYTTGHIIETFTTGANIGVGGIDLYGYVTSTSSFTVDNISLVETP